MPLNSGLYTVNPNSNSGGMKKGRAFMTARRNPYYPMTKENVYAHIKATKYIEEQVRKRSFQVLKTKGHSIK